MMVFTKYRLERLIKLTDEWEDKKQEWDWTGVEISQVLVVELDLCYKEGYASDEHYLRYDLEKVVLWAFLYLHFIIPII